MSQYGAMTELCAGDVYPYESWVRVKLTAWSQWVRGDGVSIECGRRLVMDEDTARLIEINRDDFRLPIAVADAERTDRAVQALRKSDGVGWHALRTYHFGGGPLRSSDQRTISRFCKVRCASVPALLSRAHESLYLLW